MRYIKQALLLFIMTFCFFLTACSLGPNVKKTNQPEEVEQPPAVELEPYLEAQQVINKEVKQRFIVANKAMVDNKFDEAEKHYLWIIENYPEYSRPYINLAVVYSRMNKITLAESYFLKAIQINVNNLNSYNRYAIFLRQQGRFKEAESQYLRGINIWESSPISHKNIAILYELYLGDLDKALKHYQRYLALLESDSNPNNKKAIRQAKGWIIDVNRRLSR